MPSAGAVKTMAGKALLPLEASGWILPFSVTKQYSELVYQALPLAALALLLLVSKVVNLVYAPSDGV